jgi:guanylate kinase
MPPKFSSQLIVLSGPSGSGKTTLGRLLAKRLGLHYGVSHTTRSMRAGEKDGFDYIFVDQKEFKRMIAEGEFLEWALVYGQFSGTSRSMCDEYLLKGKQVVVDVDTQGALAIQKSSVPAVLIFIETASEEDLKNRLLKRATESETELKKRLEAAQNERALKVHYDHVVVNHDLEQAYREIEEIVKRF